VPLERHGHLYVTNGRSSAFQSAPRSFCLARVVAVQQLDVDPDGNLRTAGPETGSESAADDDTRDARVDQESSCTPVCGLMRTRLEP